MLKRMLSGMVAIGVAALVVQSLPDLARYLKIREM